MSYALKYRRAQEHFNSLDLGVKRWLYSDACTVDQKRNPDTFEYIATVRINEGIPDTLALELGDFLFNARACLDHLVYELALAYSGTMTDTESRLSKFPIHGKAAPSPKEVSNSIGKTHPDVQDIILGLQPYHYGRHFEQHQLWKLSELNNIDKHRSLHPALLYAPGWGIGSTADIELEITHSFVGLVEDGTDLMCGFIRPRYEGANTNIDIQFPLDIVVTDLPSTLDDSVFYTCVRIIHYIRDEVFPVLVPFL